MSRRVIQLATMPGTQPPALYALCNDGTIWSIVSGRPEWENVSTRGIAEGIPKYQPEVSQ